VTADLRPTVSREALAAFLAERLGGPVEALRPVRPGELARVFAFELAGQGRIVRLAFDGAGFEADRLAHERFAVHGLPIPRVLEIGRFGDLWYAVSERLPGRIMLGLPGEEYDRALPALLALHDRIAAIELGPGAGWLGPDGRGSHPSWAAFLTSIADQDAPGFWHGWRRLFETTFLDRELWEELHRRFLDLVPLCPEERRLVHGDFGYDNVLVEGERVTALLDWANAKVGDPLFDVAYLGFWSPRQADLLRSRYGTVPAYDHRVACYHLYFALDGLRFYARAGRRESYDWLLERIETL
jgi:hygromycin-B 4-O-kinase